MNKSQVIARLEEVITGLKKPTITYSSTREPLSEEEIGTHAPFHYHDDEQKAFAVGVRWAEHQHGITGVDDE